MDYAYYSYLAATYGQGNYGDKAYSVQSTTSSGTTGGNTGGNPDGVLTNTGFDIALIVTIACIVTFVALIVRFWKRPAKKQPEATPTETSSEE